MIKLGETQVLEIVKKVNFGVYLADPKEDGVQGGAERERVLLPIKQVPAESKAGDQLNVFIYRDSNDRLIATVNTPKLKLGEVGILKVVQTGNIGAFLDWGLEKDLLLPFRQQTKPVKENDEVLVAVYIDKSSRLCATMNVYKYLTNRSPYIRDMKVKGRIYQISDKFGAFVAVDNRYQGLIPKRECYTDLEVGQDIEARVTAVLDDGRLNLSIREKAYIQMAEDADRLMELIDSNKGSLPFTDKASPEVIKAATGMSKNEFKRAVGALLRTEKIELTDRQIRKI